MGRPLPPGLVDLRFRVEPEVVEKLRAMAEVDRRTPRMTLVLLIEREFERRMENAKAT